MIKNNKNEIMGVMGLALFGIFIGCASPDDSVKTPKGMHRVEDAKAKFRAEAEAHNDSVAKAWKEYFNEQNEQIVSSNTPTVMEILLEHEVDSTKIIAIAYPDDAFTDFEEAFMTARYELGKNKHFVWINKMYSTNYKEEGYSGEFTK